jgi:Flp pilus assembly protein TadB
MTHDSNQRPGFGREQRVARIVAISAGLTALVAFGVLWFAQDVGTAIVAGLAAFTLLLIAFIAALEA